MSAGISKKDECLFSNNVENEIQTGPEQPQIDKRCFMFINFAKSFFQIECDIMKLP